MSQTTYTVPAHERWDQVAYKAYGDPFKVGAIIEANPNVPISDVVPPGTVLNIPILEDPEVNKALLPPWKR